MKRHACFRGSCLVYCVTRQFPSIQVSGVLNLIHSCKRIFRFTFSDSPGLCTPPAGLPRASAVQRTPVQCRLLRSRLSHVETVKETKPQKQWGCLMVVETGAEEEWEALCYVPAHPQHSDVIHELNSLTLPFTLQN